MLSGTRMEAFMANEASCLNDPDRPSHEPARGKVGVGHARGGDAVGASRKIEKVVHYGAVHFGASLVRRFTARKAVLRAKRRCIGEVERKTQKVMQNDAF